jgi:hypothetical protein
MTAGGEQAAAARAHEGGGVHVFAVVRRGAVRPPEPARLVDGDGLAAVVGDAPPGRRAGRAEVETHDRVLGELLGGAVIPLRFGVVMDSEDEVREQLLARHAPALEALLERLDGRVQMSVRAYYAEDELLRRVLQRRPELRERGRALETRPAVTSQNERIALGQEVASEVEAQREMDERMLAEPLAAVAEDVRVDPPATERQALSVQLLVDAARRPELDEAVSSLSEEHAGRISFRYVGPIAPYSFAALSLDGDDDRWG